MNKRHIAILLMSTLVFGAVVMTWNTRLLWQVAGIASISIKNESGEPLTKVSVEVLLQSGAQETIAFGNFSADEAKEDGIHSRDAQVNRVSFDLGGRSYAYDRSHHLVGGEKLLLTISKNGEVRSSREP